MEEPQINLSPVSGWETHQIPVYEVVTLTFQYLVSPMEPATKSHTSPRFAMSPAQLRELATALERAAAQVEAASAALRTGRPSH